MEDLISVIIPVYNVESYLRKCMNSILQQTYSNLEILLIDDGSSDSSGKICDEYEELDKRVTVIHQRNQGLSMARNAGIEKSNGAWIYFIDSDDWIDKYMIEVLYNLAQKYNADISSCNSIDVRENGEILSKRNDTNKEFIYENEQIILGFLDENKFIRFEVWNKLWSRQLIGDLRFKRNQVSEDIYFDRKLFLKCNKLVHIDKSLHYYVTQRPGNTNSSFKIQRMSIFDEYKQWIEELQKMNYTKALDTVASMACNTSAGLYYEAVRTKQGENIKNELKSCFRYFYPYVKGKKSNTSRIRLFHSSPWMYCLISNLYKKVRNTLWSK